MKFSKTKSESKKYNILPETILLKNGLVVDPSQKINGKMDILIENGTIKEVGPEISGISVEKEVDLQGKLIFPGFFDMHVHLREPGREGVETISSGCLSAANGGFTSVTAMPNTNPNIDSQEIIQYISDRAKDLLVDVYPIATVTKGRQGEELAEILELVEAGAVAISDDGAPIMSSEIMRRALEYTNMVGIPVICHEEDIALTEGAHMNESFNSTLLGFKGWPSIAESIMVQRDISIAKYTGGKIHIAHISTKEAVEMVRKAKKDGIKITAEATPHHFSLTDDAVKSFNTNTKMNPPLREEADRQAIIEGLADGTIDAIVTDHAPHSIEEKEMEYIYAPYGIIGLETAIGLTITNLVKTGKINLEKMAELMSVNPRKALNLEIQQIKAGNEANLTIIDPDAEWKVNEKNFLSKSINSPFIGAKLTGKPHMVVNNGKCFKSIL